MRKIKLNNKLFYGLFSLALCICIIGGSLNAFAKASNGGKMPVYVRSGIYEDEKYFTFEDKNDVKLFALCDRFPIKGIIYSLGDFFLLFSLILSVSLLIIVNFVYFWNKCHKHNIYKVSNP
jgi:hypothetical protein